MEIWKLIPSSILGFENTTYFVSNQGRVRSKDYIMKLTPFIKSGYLSVNIGRKRRRVHVLVASVFVDNPENKPFVDHGDNDVTNNAAWNLKWVTHQENMELKKLRGGKKRPNARFTKRQSFYIYSMKGIKTSRVLAKELKCLPENISDLWRGVGKHFSEHKMLYETAQIAN